jgi:hypothetical protein
MVEHDRSENLISKIAIAVVVFPVMFKLFYVIVCVPLVMFNLGLDASPLTDRVLVGVPAAVALAAAFWFCSRIWPKQPPAP